MENTNGVLNEVAVNEEVAVVEACDVKKCPLKKAGIVALGVVATVVTVKLTKKAWKKWVKPAIEKKKAAKAAAKETETNE